MSNLQSSNAVLSGDEDIFHVPEHRDVTRVNPTHPFYNYHDKLFNPSHFLNGLMPILLGRMDFAPTFLVGTRILRTPIKVAGSRDVHIPKEVRAFTDFIKFCVMYELSFNAENFVDLYAIMTVHSKDIVVAERNTMRISGFHVDGLKGNKFPVDTKLRHSYLWTNNNPTEFCPQPYFVHTNSNHATTNEFDRQARVCNVVTPLDKTVVLFDQYMVHRSPVIPFDCTRMFMRISFMYTQLKDRRDTVNPNLPVELPPICKRVVEQSEGASIIPYSEYGLKNSAAAPP